ncbi:MAG: class I SAM-dependent methyltransferase [Flavobacterium sp.]|uniref:class I SAM-dependent methyltransferase n=1 Tax=Flavobacterium sp. TaxID=239 RepID=UPI0022C8B60F|nr:class I SAM-dependent methyltransferase [Flavobacterium sp.]MCZ8197540.1 class I SAM-dependent methyltransferase [Flavobacterium sp.]
MNFSRKIFWLRKRISWNHKYFVGKWNYIDKETSRYLKIVEFVKEIDIEKPDILDLGCGFGSLRKNIKIEDFSNFLGIDLSDTAIYQAKKKKYENTKFLVSDIQRYSSNEKYDVIVFNEVIYYLDNYMETLKHYSNFFKDGNGYFIISIYGIGQNIIDDISKEYQLIKTENVHKKDNIAYWGITLFKTIN